MDNDVENKAQEMAEEREADRIAKDIIESEGYSMTEWETGKVPEDEAQRIRKKIDFSISASIIGVFPAPDPDDI